MRKNPVDKYFGAKNVIFTATPSNWEYFEHKLIKENIKNCFGDDGIIISQLGNITFKIVMKKFYQLFFSSYR